MAYRLKNGQPDIDVVDGPFAGKQYRHGQEYDSVPPDQAHRFEEIKPQPEAKKQTKGGEA
ncbi:MAG TPA: hypothetical protein PLB81_05905 [Deltaproteobacteria bacterium]|nr:hypothetical protein [Deltaproteobacteria bacterium]